MKQFDLVLILALISVLIVLMDVSLTHREVSQRYENSCVMVRVQDTLKWGIPSEEDKELVEFFQPKAK
jgi:hypothetical protein